jgi:hypothetical protein
VVQVVVVIVFQQQVPQEMQALIHQPKVTTVERRMVLEQVAVPVAVEQEQ